MTTFEQVNDALREINPKAVPDSPIGDCQTCGWAEVAAAIPEERVDDATVAFFHEQDASAFEGFDEDDPEALEPWSELQDDLYLAWMGDPVKIAAVFDKRGINYVAPPSDATRFKVLP